jgi:hypothetical protein
VSVPLAILGYAIPVISESLNGKVVAVDLWDAPARMHDSAVPDLLLSQWTTIRRPWTMLRKLSIPISTESSSFLSLNDNRSD